MEFSFSKMEALIELNVFRSLFNNRLVFLSFGAIKSNLSENVLGYRQNSCRTFSWRLIKVLSIFPAAGCPWSHVDRLILMKRSRNKGEKPLTCRLYYENNLSAFNLHQKHSRFGLNDLMIPCSMNHHPVLLCYFISVISINLGKNL